MTFVTFVDPLSESYILLDGELQVPAILSLIHERLHFANVAKDKKTSSVHL
jgi:hypothetical protein